MPSRQPELFERAAECQRLMNLSADPLKKQTFTQLRDVWIALANECPGMSSETVTEEVASIEEIQVAFSQPDQPAMAIKAPT